jgi:arylsulfatase A-like enzyme
MKRPITALMFAVLAIAVASPASAQSSKPNIVVIFGDDIGYWNVGAYTHGMMGRTPNIDRIAKEGIVFTDHYGQPSCTAGRAAFLMGQMPIRTVVRDFISARLSACPPLSHSESPGDSFRY